MAMEGSRLCSANLGQSDEVINACKAWTVWGRIRISFHPLDGEASLDGVFPK